MQVLSHSETATASSSITISKKPKSKKTNTTLLDKSAGKSGKKNVVTKPANSLATTDNSDDENEVHKASISKKGTKVTNVLQNLSFSQKTLSDRSTESLTLNGIYAFKCF